MPMSPTRAKVHALAARYDATLRADDPRFNRTVVVVHEDGSAFRWEHAWAAVVTRDEYLGEDERVALAGWKAWDAESDESADESDDDPVAPAPYPRFKLFEHRIGWLVVFSEHNGFHVFHRDDLENYAVYERGPAVEEFPDDFV